VIPHAFAGMMHAWQFYIPIYGWMMKMAHGIAVHPGKNRFHTLVEDAKKRVKDGFSILTFPEGHRTKDGKVNEFHKGVFLMAREAGMPVVPIAVRGMFEVNRKGKIWFRPGKVEVYVGCQVETAGLSDEALMKVISHVECVVKNFVEEKQSPVLRNEAVAT